jgi:predicted MFS family arabinose efflux permease
MLGDSERSCMRPAIWRIRSQPVTPGRPTVPVAVLAAAFLFNLGQGVLRPSMPLYLERTFAANYRMVTLIPVVFGAGKWIANLPTGYFLSRLGRSLMIGGLVLIALVDIVSVKASRYDAFLGLRALGGIGWAMFATVATTAMVSAPEAQRRGRAISLLLTSETSGLLLGSAAGGWLYQGMGTLARFCSRRGVWSWPQSHSDAGRQSPMMRRRSGKQCTTSAS